jgi:hypothetical protein
MDLEANKRNVIGFYKMMANEWSDTRVAVRPVIARLWCRWLIVGEWSGDNTLCRHPRACP